MDVLSKVGELVEPSLNGLGYDLVRVAFQSGTLQVMAERRDEGDMTVEDCADISRTVGALLDVADLIKGRYTLEISSPGLDRPLVRLSDYERFAGRPAHVELKVPLAGRKRFKGVLRGANGTAVRLEQDGELVELPFAGIVKAALELEAVLPPKGIKKGRSNRKGQGNKKESVA